MKYSKIKSTDGKKLQQYISVGVLVDARVYEYAYIGI